MGRWLFACLVCQLVIPWQLSSAAVGSNTTYPGIPQPKTTTVSPEVRQLSVPSALPDFQMHVYTACLSDAFMWVTEGGMQASGRDAAKISKDAVSDEASVGLPPGNITGHFKGGLSVVPWCINCHEQHKLQAPRGRHWDIIK